METHRVHAAAPVAHVLDVMFFQVRDGGRGRRKRHLAGIVDGAQPLPHAVGQCGGVVLRGEAGHVRLVERHGRDALLTRDEGAGRAEHERAGQVNDVRLKVTNGAIHGGGGHAHRQGIYERNLHRGHAMDGKAQVIRDFFLTLARARRHNDGLVSLRMQVLQDAQHRVGYSVDVGQERFSNNGDTHVLYLYTSESAGMIDSVHSRPSTLTRSGFDSLYVTQTFWPSPRPVG